MGQELVSQNIMGILQKLCSWSRAKRSEELYKKMKGEDGDVVISSKLTESSYINKFSIEIALYLISRLDKDDFERGHVDMRYDSITSLAAHFSEFCQCDDTSQVSPKRLPEALSMLQDIGFLTIERDESDTNERENYGFGSKQVWSLRIELASFDWFTGEATNLD